LDWMTRWRIGVIPDWQACACSNRECILDVIGLHDILVNSKGFLICIVIGAVRRTAPVRNSFLQFTELHLSTEVHFSSANWTNEFVIGSVRSTKPSSIAFCCGNLWDPSSRIWCGPWCTSQVFYQHILIISGFFAKLTLVTSRHTDCSAYVTMDCILSYALWCGLTIIIAFMYCHDFKVHNFRQRQLCAAHNITLGNVEN